MKIRCALMVLAAGLVLQATLESAAPAEIRATHDGVRPVAPGKPLIQTANGRLTAKLRDVPLPAVLAAVGAQNGIRIFVSAQVHKRVTADFRGLPLEEGLRRLLRGTNVAYFYTKRAAGGGKNAALKLIRVDVLPGPAGEADIEVVDDDEGVAALANHLVGGDGSESRSEAAKALGKTGNPSAVDPLAETLAGDADPAVRAAAAKALGKTWSEEAVQPLAEAALQDSSAEVREAATRALGETWSDAATGSLLEALAYDKDALVREQAALALGQTAGDEAVEALIRALLEDWRWFVRDGAATALAAIGTPMALWALAQYAMHDPD
ncbi:MAG: HEAT repeat domain-containing protein [Candidatus Binatia bacterium]